MVENGYLYVIIIRGTHSIKQSSILVYDNLVDNIPSSNYSSIRTTIGMWKHDTKNTNVIFVWMILGLNISAMEIHAIY